MAKVPGLLDKLCSAIATAEGFFAPGDTLPKRQHNPGDLRPWPGVPIPQSHGFLNFSEDAQGIAYCYRQIALDIAKGWSLRRLVYSWAPPTDGNVTSNYLTETARRVGITDLDEPLWNLLDCEYLP